MKGQELCQIGPLTSAVQLEPKEEEKLAPAVGFADSQDDHRAATQPPLLDDEMQLK